MMIVTVIVIVIVIDLVILLVRQIVLDFPCVLSSLFERLTKALAITDLTANPI